MATITGLTAERMQEIIDSTIVDADVIGDNLILTKDDGSTIDAGSVRGAQGIPGTNASNLGKGAAFPAGPTDGDLFIRTDQVGDPLYKFTDGAWASAGGGLNKVTGFPATPADGDVIVRTDLNGSPMFAYSTENGWEQTPRMGAVTIPRCVLTTAANVSVPNGSFRIPFDTESSDTDALHDLATNPSRITCKTPGFYTIKASIEWAANNTGTRSLSIVRNGAEYIASVDQLPVTGTVTQQSVAVDVLLASGDYVEVEGFQNSGGNLNIIKSSSYSPRFSAAWLGGPGQTIDERIGPAAKATGMTATQSVPTGVDTAIAFGSTEEYDTDAMHDLATNPSRINIKTSGLYRISGSLAWNADVSNTGGIRVLKLRKNGSTQIGENDRLSTGDTTHTWFQQVYTEVLLNAGDYVELLASQDSGGAKIVGAAANDVRNYLSVVSIGRTISQPLTPSNIVVAQSYPAWSDDFTTDQLDKYPNISNNWMDSYPPAFVVSGGQLGVAPTNAGGPRILLVPGLVLGHGKVEGDVPVVGDQGAGATILLVLLWINADNNIFARQDSGSMLIMQRLNGVESTLTSVAAAAANGSSAYYKAMITGETIRFMRWNAQPDVVPPAGPNFNISTAVPNQFLGRAGRVGIGIYADGGGGAGSRATKIDNFRAGQS